MNTIISVIILLVLIYSSFFVFEGFTTSALTCVDGSDIWDADANGITCGKRIEDLIADGLSEDNAKANIATAFPESCGGCAPTIPTTEVADKLKYFELNNNSKNLINRRESEKELINLQKEEDKMHTNVRKIVDEANNVLKDVNLNMRYFEEVVFKPKTTI